MGIIRNQGIKNTLLNYSGAVIGVLSTLIIYPLDRAIYGYAQFLQSSAMFLVPFASLGINAFVIKFYPKFKEDTKQDHGFLGLSLLIGSGAFMVFLSILYLFKASILKSFEALGMNQSDLNTHLGIILTLCYLLFLTGLFSSHIFNLKKIVFPNFVQNFLWKIVLPILVFLHFKSVIDQFEFANFYILFYALVVILLVVYLIKNAAFNIRPQINFVTKKLRREIFSYLSYSSLNSIGNILVYRIDVIMVAMLLGFTEAGSYGIFLVLCSLLEIPRKSINQIAAPVISESWKVNDTTNIQNIFTKSTNVLLVIGGFIYLCAWLNINEIVELSTNTAALDKVKYIFFYLGLAKLIELSASVNTQIIIYSKFYRYNLVFILFMGIATVFTNFYFIKAFGVVGAAMATGLTIFVYVILKLLFIKIVMGLQPFTFHNILVVIIGVVAYFLVLNLPSIPNVFLSLIIKSGLFTVLYALPIYLYRLSPEINRFVDENILPRIKNTI